MKYHDYIKELKRVEYETSFGSDVTRRNAAQKYQPYVREIVKQIGEDRVSYTTQWTNIRRAWQDPENPDGEPYPDQTRASKARTWKMGSALMFVIEATFASWLATTYLASSVLPGRELLRTVLLLFLGVLLTTVVTVLFHKAMAVVDDEKRPEPSYKRMTRNAAWASAIGLVAIAGFLLTRQYSIGGIVIQAALALMTISLAAGAAASEHCASILARANRIANMYDVSDKLVGRAEIILNKLNGLLTPSPEEGK